MIVSLRPDTPRDDVLPAIFRPLTEDMAELAGRFTPEQRDAVHEWIAATTGILHRRTLDVSERAEQARRRGSGALSAERRAPRGRRR